MSFLEVVKKGKNQVWIWVLTLLVVMYPFYTQIYNFLTLSKGKSNNNLVISDSGIINGFIIKTSLRSIGFLIILLLSVRFLHQRNILSVFTGRKSFSWYRFFFGLISWALFVMMYFSIGYFQFAEAYYLNFKLVPFLKLFFICITLVALRAVFIEVLFRGYILQGITLLTKQKCAPILASSILYMLVFSSSKLLDRVGYELLLFHFATALIAGIIAVVDDGLEIPISMQLANNLVGILYISTTWHGYQTDAVFIDTSPPKVLYLVYIPVLIFFPIYFFVLKKVFKWDNLKEKLM